MFILHSQNCSPWWMKSKLRIAVLPGCRDQCSWLHLTSWYEFQITAIYWTFFLLQFFFFWNTSLCLIQKCTLHEVKHKSCIKCMGGIPFTSSQYSFYRTQVSLGSDLWVLMSVHTRLCWDLTDVTLADEDSNSIPTSDVNRAFLGNVAMQVAPSDGQHWIKCKWHHLVTKLVTNSRSANCWPNLQLMHVWWQKLEVIQVMPPDGQNWN